ncbi:MAG: cell division topological specificity factor MinE [Firmicutes bacterium]|nr:cell division topological specificity factor MinE [Bacillota bacterium]
MFDFFRQLWDKEERAARGSKQAAKERLQLILVHDRADISPQLLDSLKEELIAVISKYMEIDDEGFAVDLKHCDSSVALVANIPVLKLKRSGESPSR